MTRLTVPRLSLLLPGLLALALTACGGGPEVSPSDHSAAVAVSGGGVTVDVVTTNVWQGGFNGALRITDVSFPSPVTTFQVVFRLAGSAGVAGSAWNGDFSAPDSAGNRTATSPAWLQYGPIRAGGSWDVGFNGSGTFSGSTIVSVVINGQVIPIGGGDTTAPTVSLAASATTVTTASTLTLTATAADNVGVARVEFYDGATLLGTDATSPYAQAVALTTASNGTHAYTARAYDAAGNVGTSSAVSVTVNIPGGDTTPPTVSLAASASTVTVAGNLTLTATAADNVGVARVEFYDGATLLGTDATSPYGQTVALTAANNGTHAYTARAYDAAGNVGTSTPVSVTVSIGGGDTIPPTVSLAASASTVTVAGNLTLTATAADNVGVARVEFYDGTTLVVTDASVPYTQLVALTSAQNGVHTYTAKAFDAAGNSATSAPVSVTVNIPAAGAVFRVDTQGRITRNGTLFPVRCGAWFGLEGRHEPSNDSVNPSGAPMELYVGNTFWANGGAGTGRTIQQTMTEIVAAGITVVRFPVVPQTLNATDPQGMAPNLKNHASVRVANSRLALEQWIKAAAQNNIQVILDIHSCSNYVGWRKGRLDARPPYVDRNRDNYDFKREDSSCAATNNPAGVTRIQAYNETLWLNDVKTLAGLGQQLGVDNIIGIDIFNEPWDYSWQEWKTLSEHAYQAINAVNPNTLIFIEGIGSTNGNQDGTPATIVSTPFGTVNPNWGENLFEAGANLPNIPRDRIVFSPHTYGPSVAVQPQFMDPAQPACAGLEGDAAGDAKCNIVINPTLLRQGWQEHFGYLKDLGYAVVVGEFGGNMDWPKGKASLRDQARYSYLAPGTDQAWQNAFVDYMVSKGIEGCYWSINPESGDTGGWYGTTYDPVSNTSGWGEWLTFDSRKTTLLNRLWGR